MEEKTTTTSPSQESSPYNLPHKPQHFMTKKITIVLIFFLLFSLASLIGALYVINLEEQSISEGRQQNKIPSRRVSSTPTPTPDPTATWKTYQNNTLGFSLRYPSEEFPLIDVNQDQLNYTLIQFVPHDSLEGDSQYLSMFAKSPFIWVEVFTKEYGEEHSYLLNEGVKTPYQHKDLTGYQLENSDDLPSGYFEPPGGAGLASYAYYFTTNNYIYKISINKAKRDAAKVRAKKQLLDTIVNTLDISTPPDSSAVEKVTMCTLEARVCPDGSTVGRQGPNCEFAACPGE